MTRPVIVCYDGAKARVEALDYAVGLLPSVAVIVVTVWRELTEEMLSSGAAPPAGDPVEVNPETRQAAREAAEAGAESLRAAGLNAEPLVVKTTGSIWKAIEAVAV